MRIITLLLTILLLNFSSISTHAATEKIAAVVNEDAISLSEVNDRLRLVIASSGLPNTEEIRSKLIQQVMSSLIEEQLKIQEARRLDIQINQEEINQGFAAIAQQNNFTSEQFLQMLKKSGINIETMYQQIRAQLSWSKIVQQQIRPNVDVTDSDIDNVLLRHKANTGQMEYLVAEIFLPVDDPKNESDTRQLAQRLSTQISTGQAPFFKLAQQFSKAAGASQGGNMGWVQQTQLPEKLADALQTMSKESVSNPVRSVSGYHILFLRDLRQISDETMPTREQVTSQLGLERLERLQRRYYLDLKAAAFIENRVDS